LIQDGVMLNDNVPAGSQILPFYLADGSSDVALIRGRMASVGPAASTIIERHAYPDLVGRLQAEALALAACLSSTLKFDGVFTLQAKGDGLVRTLFADITESGDLRGYCALDEDHSQLAAMQLAQPHDEAVHIVPLMGGGYIAFTVDDHATGGRYQGIVELDGPYLSDAAMRWFENSEQTDTMVLCAAGKDASGWQASALMLQRIATEGGDAESAAGAKATSDDAWHTAKTLLSSVTRGELLDPALTPEEIIFRLFNSMAPHVAPARVVTDQCRCDVQKVESMLSQLSVEDVNDLADADGTLRITCEFCKTERLFNKNDLPSWQS
jgi:molecular chaperone Hsp33